MVDSLAVKPCSGRATVVDGPLEAGQAALALPIDAANSSPVDDDHRAEPSNQPNQTAYVQPTFVPQTESHQPSNYPHVSANGHHSSTSDPAEIHGHHPKAQQDLVLEPQASRGCSLVPMPDAACQNRTSKSRTVFKLLPIDDAKTTTQQLPSGDQRGNSILIDLEPSRSGRAQDLLHAVSSRAGPIRVTKTSKQTQSSHGTCAPFPVGHQRMHTKSAGLEDALDALRTAYLGDQHQLEDQMITKEKAWQCERSDLQALITQQLETISEQRFKLEESEKRFAEFAADLTVRLKSSQKFIAGLQRDHEKLQQSTVSIHEQNKKVLQTQIAQVLQEKLALQAEFDVMVKSCEKSQKSMFETMHELQLRYVTALSRENGLKIQLHKRATMYEEERQRGTKLEQQFLPSVQKMQHQLSESCATLVEEIGTLRASIKIQTDETSCNSTVKQCLLTLQQLQSLPLLTSKDVRKVESMLETVSKK